MFEFMVMEISESEIIDGHGRRRFLIAPAMGDVIEIDGVEFEVVARALPSEPTDAAGDLFVRKSGATLGLLRRVHG